MLVHFFYKLGESSRSLTWDKAKASYILGQRKYNESTSLVMQGGLSLFSLHSYSWGCAIVFAVSHVWIWKMLWPPGWPNSHICYYGEVAVCWSWLVLSVQVIYKTLSPQWNQTFEFPETGEPLILHVKDHNAILPTASIGHCTVEYSMLSPNQSANKWIPLQGVNCGEIHVKIARRVSVSDSGKKAALGTDPSGKGHKIATQVWSLSSIDPVYSRRTLPSLLLVDIHFFW